MKANGLAVFNCTEKSALKVFPFVPLSKAVAAEAIVLNEKTQGMYARK